MFCFMFSQIGYAYIDAMGAEDLTKPASPVEACILDLDEPKDIILDALDRVEHSFIKMKWQYWKYREVYYTPLWSARNQRETASFAAEKAQGQVLIGKFSHLATVYLSEAEDEEKSLWDAFKTLHSEIRRLDDACLAWEYEDCFQYWYDPVRYMLINLEKLLTKYIEKEKALATKVEATLKENQSEHMAFAERYYAEITDMNYKFYPDFLKWMRNLRAAVEWKWVGTACCKYCTAEALKNAKDPLFGDRNRTRVSERRGIGGATLNKNDIVKAFDEFERAQTPFMTEAERESIEENVESMQY